MERTNREARYPLTYVFGFGRRICPGMDFAIDSKFIAIAMSLATLNIVKEKMPVASALNLRWNHSTDTVRYVLHIDRLATCIF